MSSIHPACDSTAAQGDPSASVLHPKLVLTTTILASSLAFVDGSVVNVALPTIAQNLHADAGSLQWVINTYLLPLSALLLLGGAMGDHFGRRRLLIVGTSIFALASLGCALAPSLALLLACRVLQGLGAAMLMPNSLAILGPSFSGTSRGRAIGIWAATGAAMGAAGPVIGGWLIDLGSWRAIFLLNLPLACGAIALATGVCAARPAPGRHPARHPRCDAGHRRARGLDLGAHRRLRFWVDSDRPGRRSHSGRIPAAPFCKLSVRAAIAR